MRVRRPLRLGLVTGAIVAVLAALLSPSASQAGAVLVQDPDRNSTSVTPWGWHTHATPAQMTAFLNSGYRIVDLEPTSSAPTFTASYVRNSGAYQRGWWWYYGLTGAQVVQRLATNNARLIDIEPYNTSNGRRYAAVMVANTGAAAKAWAWYASASLATINNYVSVNGMRLIDVDRVPGTSNFAAVMIKNTGVDAKGWWHYYNITPTQVASFLSTNNARLIDFERLANGNFDVIMQTRGSEGWWWLHGATSTQISRFANQVGARIYKVKSHVVGGVRRYDALFINNVNNESTRIRNLVSGQMTGSWGFYLKRVGGSELLTIGEDNTFEPASMIKIVHAVTAMRDIQFNAATKDTVRTWYVHPSFTARYPTSTGYRTPSTTDTDHADVCPYSNTGTLQTTVPYADKLGPVLIRQTLVNSDNRTTDALTRFYGFTALNNTAALAGMTSSRVNHRIGCPSKASPQPLRHNVLTLTDAGRIWERIENGTIVNTTHRNLLYSYAPGGAIGSGGLQDMIRAEATAAGLTAAEANTFVANVSTRSKGGSYGYCPNFDGSGTCSPPTLHSRTVGGVIWLPFKNSSGTIVKTAYAYGRYTDALVGCTFASVSAGTCTAFNNNQNGMGTIAVEMFRAEVRKALASW